MQGRNQLECYARWRAVVAAHAQRVAVRELATGRAWTFAQLAALAEEAAEPPSVLVTRATGLAFLVEVLRAWRAGAVLLPDDSGSASPPRVGSLPAAVGHLKMTSGSTGQRRLVMFTADQLAADGAQIMQTMDLHVERPNLGVISMAHSYGFSNLVLPLLWHGVPLWLLENPLPHTLRLALAQASGVTLPAVPALWRAWHGAGVELQGVHTAISAGARLPVEIEAAEHARSGLKIRNFYGCSECGGIAFDRSLGPRAEAALAGTAMAGVQLAVEAGQLAVQSAAVGLGYADAEPWEPGKYVTSDGAQLAPDGTLHLLGRLGDTICVAGYKVAPALVEEALQRLPGVQHCVVFGIPSRDPLRVEEVVAVVHHAAESSLADLAAQLAHLPSPCQPRHWWSCQELRPDARGKISRAHWRQRWLGK